MQIGEVVTTIPTIGFNVESVSYKNLNFNVWVSNSQAVADKTRLFADTSLGSGRPDEYPPVLAVLLRQHSSRHLRRRLDRHRAFTDSVG